MRKGPYLKKQRKLQTGTFLVIGNSVEIPCGKPHSYFLYTQTGSPSSPTGRETLP